MPAFSIVRRGLGRFLRWAMQPPRRPFATCGASVIIHEPFTCNNPERIFIGNHIYIGGGAVLNAFGGIRIGDGVNIGPFLHVYSSNHRYDDAEYLPFDQREFLLPVDIGCNCWIGGDVVIVPGVTVGEGAIIAAGSVVTADVPAGALVGGVPARVLKQRDMERYHRLKAEGRILNAAVGLPGRYRRKTIGTVPAEWYRQAGLPVPGPDELERSGERY